MRRLGTLALVLVSNVALVVTPALAGPPAPTLDQPALEQPEERPIEGPSLPPTEPPPAEPPLPHELPPPEIEPGLEEGGSIEFAPSLPDPEAASTSPSHTPTSRLDEIGKAPDSGGGFLAGGAWLVPVAVLGTLLFVATDQSSVGRQGIIVAGTGLGVIGTAMLGIGIHRSVALSRWARRHRVRALAQGSGLLTSGTLAGLLGVGTLILAIQAQDGITGAVAGAMLVSSPIQIAVGVRFTSRYKRTGGWRPTRYTLSPGGLRLQF